jgi:hypothetical protein
MIEPELAQIIDHSVERLFSTMRRYAPVMAEKSSRWAQQLAVVGTAADYFKHILGFPVIQIPWWVEKALGLTPDPTLQAELVYSSINGYYFIRLVDNIMDGHTTIEPEILPAAALFHTESVGIYNPFFPADHPFWAAFKRAWYASAEVTLQDHLLEDKDEGAFLAISSRKVNAAKIPLLAICHLRGRPDLIEPWSNFIDRFGMWHLFEEDLFDWHIDLSNQTRTYFLCEAERQKLPGETVEAWALREGFPWGLDVLRRWMPEVRQAANALGSPDAAGYLAERSAYLARRAEKLQAGISTLRALITTSE